MTFGQKVEWIMIKLLLRFKYNVVHSQKWEDRRFKVDIWIEYGDRIWIPVQFSIDKIAMNEWKAEEARKRGIVPIYMSALELEIAWKYRNGAELVKIFWQKIEEELSQQPIKRFKIPKWKLEFALKEK